MRQIVLDTETTGLEPSDGHRIIEIGCVEVINRKVTENHYHQYIQPDREIDQGAIEVHGITNEFLTDKPRFNDIVESFLEYIEGAELIIHNAAFDVGFLNHEINLMGQSLPLIEQSCKVTDTLKMARKLHPGQKNNLDALCKRYFIDNSQRTLHGALLDAEILAEVYLAMTGGQVTLGLDSNSASAASQQQEDVEVNISQGSLLLVQANEQELAAHEAILADIRKANDGECVWDKLD